MKKFLATIFLTFALCGIALADEFSDVYLALKRVEAVKDTSNDRRDFRKAISNAQYYYNLLKESSAMYKNKELSIYLFGALDFYKIASDIWDHAYDYISSDTHFAQDIKHYLPDYNIEVKNGGIYIFSDYDNQWYIDKWAAIRMMCTLSK